MLALLSFRKIKKILIVDMSRNDMEDKLNTVIKRVSKRGTIKYKWIVVYY